LLWRRRRSDCTCVSRYCFVAFGSSSIAHMILWVYISGAICD
jgi:hypothetical protein